jgi:hypothetical protein
VSNKVTTPSTRTMSRANGCNVTIVEALGRPTPQEVSGNDTCSRSLIPDLCGRPLPQKPEVMSTHQGATISDCLDIERTTGIEREWLRLLLADCTHPASDPKAALRHSAEQSDSDQQRRSLSWNPLNAENPGTKASWLARSRL